MSINNAELGPDNNLINTIADLQRQIRELKTSTQPIGAESLKVGSLPSNITQLYLFGPFTVAANTNYSFTLTFTPLVSLLTLWTFQFGLYIDVFDGPHGYPNGSSLTNAQLSVYFAGYDNLTQFNSAQNKHAVTAVVRNFDSASHNYYIGFRSFLPLTTGATTA